jgi:lipopolysaccharide assembly outer membrane protein LptD (OstA)
MKGLVLVILVVIFCALGLTQSSEPGWQFIRSSPGNPHSKMAIHAGAFHQSSGSLARLTGGVEIKSDTMILWADQVELNTVTGEAIPSGHIHFKMLYPPDQKK